MKWSAFVALAFFALVLGRGIGSASASPVMPGAWSDVSTTNGWVVAAARFAVKAQEQAMTNGQANAKAAQMSLLEIMKAEQQVVAGVNYLLHLKVKVDGLPKEAEATVWRRVDGEHSLTSWVWRPQ